MAVRHDACVVAEKQLRTLADAERLARDPELGLSFEVLLHFLSQKTVSHIKSTHGKHTQAAARYVERYLAGESLISLAESLSLPPTKLARIILENHLGAGRRGEASQVFKNPKLLSDLRLQQEVAAAVEADAYQGPHVDTCKRLIGLEYEDLLEQKLRAQGVPFLTEEQQRLRGDAKTPDVLLPVPLLVRGRVVNWIDSKAMFGDPTTHSEYGDQFRAYVNRFDAGLVIYWFGYDASIDADVRCSSTHVCVCMSRASPSKSGTRCCELSHAARVTLWRRRRG